MQKNTHQPNSDNSQKEFLNLPLILIVIAYLLLDYAPKLMSIDVSGIQWLVLSIFNVILGYFIYQFSKNNEIFELKNIQSNTVLSLYTIHVLLSGVAILYADNFSEAILTFIHMSLILCFVYLLKIIGQLKGNFLKHLVISISIFAFFQSFVVFSSFISKVKVVSTDDLYNVLTQNSGNINIFAAQLALKIPFILIGLYKFDGLKKVFFSATFIFSVIVVFLTLARTSIISTVVISILFIALSFTRKLNKVNIVIVASGLLLSYGLMIKYMDYLPKKAVFETASQGVEEDATSGRVYLWKNTIEIIKNAPLLGTGLGSYKIQAIPYEGKQRISWQMSKHSHNDFLQTTSETGILNGLIYLSIFILIAYRSVKLLIGSSNNENQFELSFVVFASIIIFGFDSLLNFPKERIMTLIHFALILALYFTLIKDRKPKFELPLKYTIVVLIFLSSITIYPNYMYFKSLQVQNEILLDQNKLELSYNHINNSLPSFPNLTELGYPMKYVKARYLQKENRNEEALKLCYESLKNKENNEMMTNQSVMASIYNNMNKPDSTLKYWKDCSRNYPLYEPFYANYLAQLSYKKDTSAMVKFVRTNLDLKYPPKFLFIATKFLIDAQYPIKSVDKLLKNHIDKYSKDSLVNVAKNVINNNLNSVSGNATALNLEVQTFNKLKNIKPDNWKALIPIYKELEKISPNNFTYSENVGVSYFRLGQYKNAIPYLEKVIASKTFKNGKSEYIIAACHHYLKNKSKACQYAHQAINYGYKDAQEIINKNCN